MSNDRVCLNKDTFDKLLSLSIKNCSASSISNELKIEKMSNNLNSGLVITRENFDINMSTDQLFYAKGISGIQNILKNVKNVNTIEKLKRFGVNHHIKLLNDINSDGNVDINILKPVDNLVLLKLDCVTREFKEINLQPLLKLLPGEFLIIIGNSIGDSECPNFSMNTTYIINIYANDLNRQIVGRCSGDYKITYNYNTDKRGFT